MKKLFTLLATVTLSVMLFAQAPQSFSYQTVIRDASWTVLENQSVGIKISILEDVANGNVVYEESHSASTSQIGLVNLSVGEGTVMSGSFSTIDWGNHNYFIEVAVDINGGSNYIVMGSTQLRSVPYALYAENSGSSIPGPQGPIGLTGPAGANGVDGAQGPIGLTGPAGANGIDGVDGAQGPIGLTGPAGANGIDGTDGVDGIDGAAGATGPQGPIGLTGPAGANGIDGTDGVDGIDGAAGATGAQGPIGLTGHAGANGIDGTDGVDGIDGAAGATGPQGPIGLTGPAGANGIDGVDGTDCCNAIDSLSQVVSNLDSTLTSITSLFVFGCMDTAAFNYNSSANINDGSCSYTPSIGDTYQGGIIFYLDGNGGGLIAAPTDQSFGASEWGCSGTSINTGSAIGQGAQNTLFIESGCTTQYIAADLCANLTLGGFSDWFLPSRYELIEMQQNIGQGDNLGLGNVGGFANAYYWSSTQYSSSSAAVKYFNTSSSGVNYHQKDNTYHVRAIRAF
ncbi:collagen-like protein [Flavobacteriales bacterium]|nr:collagen-like protein [Flavobacteriales bacterium]